MHTHLITCNSPPSTGVSLRVGTSTSVVVTAPSSSRPKHTNTARPSRRSSLQTLAATGEQGLVGDNFGARDPFAAELESNFGEKVLGNYNTEHIIKPPDAIKKFIGLGSKKCTPHKPGTPPLSEEEITRLKMQCAGWKFDKTTSGNSAISFEWKVKSFAAGLNLFKRIAEVAEAQGHHPDLHLEGYNTVRAVLSTHEAGGLTENDFIIASLINDLETSDLLPKVKAKFWA